jgi:hypothetical protein
MTHNIVYQAVFQHKEINEKHSNIDSVGIWVRICPHWAHSGCDRSAKDAYSSAAPDPTFTFVGGPCCPTLDFIIAFRIMITFYILLTSLFCIVARSYGVVLGMK